ncbi:MAG TPA: TRAP transporter small permease [Negativicutes bacterium]|nr:TRAP transporter small permease [Negativicutes bacterium]
MKDDAAKPSRALVIFRYIITIPMLAMVAMVFVNAVLRYAFRSGIPETEELSRYLFIWLCFLGTVAAYKDKQHVGVDILVTYLPRVPRLIVGLIGDFVVLFVLAIMFVGGIAFTRTGGATPGAATGIPFGFMSVAIIFAAVAMAVLLVIDMCRKFATRSGGAG